MKKKIIIAIICLIIAAVTVFFVYTFYYTRGDTIATLSLNSSETVNCKRITKGYFFDGPGDKNCLIFYPGERIEYTAYGPLMHELAKQGYDVILLNVPFNLAIFDIDRANTYIDNEKYDYENWYVGGHSLGGYAASAYAASHADKIKGVVVLGAVPADSKIDDSLTEVIIYGSNDKLLDTAKLESIKSKFSSNTVLEVIDGGNHAQFGSYGIQNGDGEAKIKASEQVSKTVSIIVKAFKDKK